MTFYKHLSFRFKNLSFRNRMSFSLFLFALLMAVIMGLAFLKLSLNIILESSKQVAEKNFNVVYSSLDNYFSNVDYYTTSLIRMKPLQEVLKTDNYIQNEPGPFIEINQSIREIINFASSKHSISFNTVNIYCKNGFVYNHFQNDKLPYDDYESCITFYVQNGYFSNDYMPSTWCNIYKTIDTSGQEEYNFLNTRPLYDAATFEVVGILVTGINEEDLYRYYSDFSNEAYIIHRNGDIISHSNKRKLGNSYADDEFYELISNSPRSMETVKSTIDKEVKLITYRKLASNDTYFVVPFDFYNQNILDTTRSFYISMIFVFLCALIIASVIALFLSKGLTSSILTLKSTVQAVHDGDLSARFKTNRNDEIAYLGNTLNEMMDQINNFFITEKKHERDNKNLELKLMQSQINPHLLYNTLDSTLWALDNQDLAQAKKLIITLSNFFKTSLSGGNTLIPLKKELELVCNYITIQKVARNKSIKLNIDCPSQLMHIPFIKLSIQPIVENTIIHGFSGYRDDGTIAINIRAIDNDIEVAIIDNGIGIMEHELDSLQNTLNSYPIASNANHFGLYNIQRRIKNMFGDEYGLTIKSEVGAYTGVYIRIPYTLWDRKENTKDV